MKVELTGQEFDMMRQKEEKLRERVVALERQIEECQDGIGFYYKLTLSERLLLFNFFCAHGAAQNAQAIANDAEVARTKAHQGVRLPEPRLGGFEVPEPAPAPAPSATVHLNVDDEEIPF